MATILHLDDAITMYTKVVNTEADTIRPVTRSIARQGERRAAMNLRVARATTPHMKIADPAHLTGTDKGGGKIDSWFSLTAPNPSNAMAIEFGHYPSGVFDPERYGRITKAPAGLYILTRAAFGLGSLNITPVGRFGRR
jgi:hypothetical protein